MRAQADAAERRGGNVGAQLDTAREEVSRLEHELLSARTAVADTAARSQRLNTEVTVSPSARKVPHSDNLFPPIFVSKKIRKQKSWETPPPQKKSTRFCPKINCRSPTLFGHLAGEAAERGRSGDDHQGPRQGARLGAGARRGGGGSARPLNPPLVKLHRAALGQPQPQARRASSPSVAS